MGFYIRRSFKIGPLRLNLSKSGLGASGMGDGHKIIRFSVRRDRAVFSLSR